MKYSLFPSSSNFAQQPKLVLPKHIHLISSTSRSNITPTMSLLYQPGSTGHWQATPDELESTHEVISDLLGVRMPVRPESMRRESIRRLSVSRPIATVELLGRPYRIPDPCPKQFYRELTYLSDEEIIEKYKLVPCEPDLCRAARRLSVASKASAASSNASR